VTMGDPGDLDRPCPAKVAHATVQILSRGFYRLSTEGSAGDGEDGERRGVRVGLDCARLKRSERAVVTVRIPHVSLPAPPPAAPDLADGPTLTLFQGGTFEAAQWLLGLKPSSGTVGNPCVLDFASDSEPGGGWKGKQQGTQEESLCRCSSLGLALEKHYQAHGNAEYMPVRSAVYVPDVVVFRSSPGYKLLETPFWVDVIAAALRQTESEEELRAKVDGVLRLAASRGNRRLVLGAWGCGAFGNDPGQLAKQMAASIRRTGPWFDDILFAVPRGDNFDAFQTALLGCEIVYIDRAHAESGGSGGSQEDEGLTDHHKWELLAAIPDAVSKAFSLVEATDPGDYLDKSALKRLAEALLLAVKAEVLEAVSAAFLPEIIDRLRGVLPPLETDVVCEVLGDDLSGVESDIRNSFKETAQDEVAALLQTRRREARLAAKERAAHAFS